VIGLDTNILVYAHRTDSVWHSAARQVVKALAQGTALGHSLAVRIAALSLAHGVRELWTHDRDFARFPALTVRNPLIG
jgi:predicted nucleic acid-binding protein